jgi:hypothetical protein
MIKIRKLFDSLSSAFHIFLLINSLDIFHRLTTIVYKQIINILKLYYRRLVYKETSILTVDDKF